MDGDRDLAGIKVWAWEAPHSKGGRRQQVRESKGIEMVTIIRIILADVVVILLFIYHYRRERSHRQWLERQDGYDKESSV
jgi:hypothetical protein